MLKKVSKDSSLELTLSELKDNGRIMFVLEEDHDRQFAPRGNIYYGLDASVAKYLPESLLRHIEDKQERLTIMTLVNTWWYVEGQKFAEEASLYVLPNVSEVIMTLSFPSFPFPVIDKGTTDDSLIVRFGPCSMFTKSPSWAKEEFKIRRSFMRGDRIDDLIINKIKNCIDQLT